MFTMFAQNCMNRSSYSYKALPGYFSTVIQASVQELLTVVM